jgi:hypothetical protein
MASTSETGHYKNITAFDKMILKAQGFGTTYNPSKTSIKIASLQTLSAQAKADYALVSPASITFNNAVNDRIIIFQPYKTFATQLLASFKTSSDANPQKIKDLVTINRKIQGSRTPKKDAIPVDPNEPAPETISASQQSYEMKYDHFVELVDLILSESTYAPNEVELKLPAIQAFKASLLAANTIVFSTFEAVNQTRIKRDKTLYNEKTGVYTVQGLVKEYVKSVYKVNSIQYKQMVAISFKKPPTIFI